MMENFVDYSDQEILHKIDTIREQTVLRMAQDIFEKEHANSQQNNTHYNH